MTRRISTVSYLSDRMTQEQSGKGYPYPAGEKIVSRGGVYDISRLFSVVGGRN